MIARFTPYRTRPENVEALSDEIVRLARAAGPARGTNRRVELFVVKRSIGDALSVIIGEDAAVERVITIGEQHPEEYEVRLLQVAPPTGSGTVDSLLARVVRCDADALADLSFNGDAVPTSPEVWVRALLTAPDRVVTLAVATDHGALEESLRKFSARSAAVEDYDDVAYHFFCHV